MSAIGNRGPSSPDAKAPNPSAREVLDRRLASGELTVEQYHQLREAMGDPAPTARDTRPPTPANAPG